MGEKHAMVAARRCECGGTAPVIAGVFRTSAGLPDGTVVTHRCERCGAHFEIHPVAAMLTYFAVLNALGILVTLQLREQEEPHSALLALCAALAVAALPFAWATLRRVRAWTQHPRCRG